jgi:hypothetical protein
MKAEAGEGGKAQNRVEQCFQPVSILLLAGERCTRTRSPDGLERPVPDGDSDAQKRRGKKMSESRETGEQCRRRAKIALPQFLFANGVRLCRENLFVNTQSVF